MGFVLVARDITPHARLEAERADLRNRLAQSEKLAALGPVRRRHRARAEQPAPGRPGSLELLRATGAFPNELRRDMQRIYREADRAAKIVRNLLVFAGLATARQEAHEHQRDVVARARAARARLRASNIEVVRQVSKTALPRVKGDPLLFSRRCSISCSTPSRRSAQPGAESRPRHPCDKPDGDRHVVVEIRDTGPGMSRS